MLRCSATLVRHKSHERKESAHVSDVQSPLFCLNPHAILTTAAAAACSSLLIADLAACFTRLSLFSEALFWYRLSDIVRRNGSPFFQLTFETVERRERQSVSQWCRSVCRVLGMVRTWIVFPACLIRLPDAKQNRSVFNKLQDPLLLLSPGETGDSGDQHRPSPIGCIMSSRRRQRRTGCRDERAFMTPVIVVHHM